MMSLLNWLNKKEAPLPISEPAIQDSKYVEAEDLTIVTLLKVIDEHGSKFTDPDDMVAIDKIKQALIQLDKNTKYQDKIKEIPSIISSKKEGFEKDFVNKKLAKELYEGLAVFVGVSYRKSLHLK